MRFRLFAYATVAAASLVLAGCPLPEPVANAGPDQAVDECSNVVLKASSNDPGGYLATYKWTQTGGPKVAFKVSKKGVLTFVAPETDVRLALTFSLVVTDTFGRKSKPDTVIVTVDQIKFFGTATGSADDYTNLLTWFDQITPENSGKWGSVEATRDVMTWTALDAAYDFARTNGLPFKFHTLIWGQQQPGWIGALTPQEQLEEIEEWMAEVAARYPHIDLIDVVNEPLNAPAGYREALGGAGETGYDWVIKAFEMARHHFPNAKLILNEYNTLMLEQFTANYMTVVELLQERGLIDGIGEQAHFLERADVPVVATNLDTLASTGLPIYISEFDLNYADDARQANVMRDLFTVFWDHPAVAGITHWGYRQGAMWRTNAHLVRSDGTTRPAMDWIVCYMEGGGDSCTVPEYVPAGWQGTEFGVTLEAELYDEGQGVAALGNIVAYTDDGDWIAFKGVEFQAGWDTFWITYAKGNTDPGSISIFIDGMQGTPVLTVDLPPTGSWNSADTIEQPWAALTGSHDVYIRFNTAPGVANVDSVRFGKPQPPSDVNLLPDGGFESGVAGWSSWNGATLMTTTAQVRTGLQSMLATNRPNANQFAVYNLTSVVESDTTYAVSAWVFHTGTENQTVRLASKLACASASDTYPWLQNNTAVASNTWTQLSGNLAIPAGCTPTDVAIFLEGTAPGFDVYVDDVKVVPPNNNLITDGGFESGTAGWSSWNGSTLSATTTRARNGLQSLQATNRPNTSQFAVYNLTSAVDRNTTYAVSAWALHTAAANDTARLAAKIECSAATAPPGHNTYPWLQNNSAVVPNTWTQLSANLVIPDCDIVDVAIFFEGTTAGVDVYLDDISVQ
ncbi:GH35 family endo-1,4-beta-xylanase [Povalibacter uvarum]|uniref:Beta-xylanase n=1 Tax=Povalibacter uvarum TaxID=732238 RepID=A0A841HVL6_9GAMM|nr:endo-1,4-beta-xylanase [Povalibacter uvarum]MBB6095968.1 GH35 family endo-1,4-beta-xylanase [Povalibacter uvarum]